MTLTSNSLLDPELLSSVKGLPLVSKVLSEELIAGANLSKKTGMGLEFSQYRTYEPGDDIRLLDWKLYARTDRYYVRQSVIYSNIHVRLVMDDSGSMAYEEGGISKYQYAAVLLSTLAHVAYQSGDQFSLSFVSGKSTSMGSSRKHLERLMFDLQQHQPEGQWPMTLSAALQSKSLPKELLIVVTDLYDQEGELLKTLSKIKLPKNEVVVFTISGKIEESFEFSQPVQFKDLESGKLLTTDPGKAKEDYLQQRQAFFIDMKNQLKALSIPVYEFRLDESPSEPLKKFLMERTYLHM